MVSRKNEAWKLNLRLFLLFLGSIIFVAILAKTAHIVQTSIYDGQNRFTAVLLNREEQNNLFVFSLEPKSKSILLLSFSQEVDFGQGNSLRKNVQEFVGAPIDSWIVGDLKIEDGRWNIDYRKLNKLDTNLTILDLVRLFIDSRTIDSHKIETIALGRDTSELESIASSFFYDRQIVAERKTIEVINGTNVAGRAAKIAKVITNMGNPVLFVKSATENVGKSKVFVREDSYTGEKIGSILNAPVSKISNPNTDIDIQVVIGEDY